LILLSISGKDLNKFQETWNYVIEQLRVNVENAFSRIKRWKIMSHSYRGEPEKFHCIAQVCAQLTNMNFEHYPLRQEKADLLMQEFESRAIIAFLETKDHQ
jgi:hypothetical protein